MYGELDGVDDLRPAESRDRQAAAETPSPGTEASGTVVV
jgi:hypothetical protein